jgi:exosortase
MLYRKRAMVRATFSEPTRQGSFVQQNFSLLCGVLLCTAAIFVYWFGSNTFTPMEYHMATLPFFTAGLVLVFFSGQTLRQVWFPIAFLAFLTPPPIETLYSVGSWLSDLSAHAANALANFLGIDSTILVQFGNPLIVLTRPDLSVMNLSIDVACSGVYSLIGFALFAVFMAYITRGKLWKKVAVLGLGVPLLICLNIIRLTIIVAMGYYQGAGPALEVFHTAGVIVDVYWVTYSFWGDRESEQKTVSRAMPCV